MMHLVRKLTKWRIWPPETLPKLWEAKTSDPPQKTGVLGGGYECRLFSPILIKSPNNKKIEMFSIENVVRKNFFKSCRIFWSSRNFHEKKFGHFLCFFKSLKKNSIKFKKSILKFFQIQKVSWSKNVLHDIDFLFLTSEWWYQRYSWKNLISNEKISTTSDVKFSQIQPKCLRNYAWKMMMWHIGEFFF